MSSAVTGEPADGGMCGTETAPSDDGGPCDAGDTCPGFRFSCSDIDFVTDEGRICCGDLMVPSECVDGAWECVGSSTLRCDATRDDGCFGF